MSPSADHVAWAIVAAARETGEDAEACVKGALGLRCRHYAMHALAAVFPKTKKFTLARLVGAPGTAMSFWNNSVTSKFHLFVAGPRAGKRNAKWWDEAAFERVIASIKSAARTTVEVSDPEALDPPPARTPVKLSARFEGVVEPNRPASSPGKRKLEDMLREAVQNTARMPVGK